MKTKIINTDHLVELTEGSLEAVVSLIANIVEMACEHEPDLEMMRLINFMDLYRTYLSNEIDDEESQLSGAPALPDTAQSAAGGKRRRTEIASFEQFIGDPGLLHLAAQLASQSTGNLVPTPLPLRLSANSSQSDTI